MQFDAMKVAVVVVVVASGDVAVTVVQGHPDQNDPTAGSSSCFRVNFFWVF